MVILVVSMGIWTMLVGYAGDSSGQNDHLGHVGGSRG